ncbi:MAG TPA: hypothetical protein QF499_05480 [Gammaproteobacteria bacterium]|jgi:hypothetical protein|nr:hypothetical protein [Gammaproteobacteria bacterium]HJP38568.1 hypothetical protein [Gammaproteobacteria bacterium]
MLKLFLTRLGVAVVLSVASVGVHAASYTASLVDLYSATFDGALTPDAGLFFGGDPSMNPRNIAITPAGLGSATVVYDGTTLTQLDIILPQMTLLINSGQATETHILTNGVPISLDITGLPATDTEAGFPGFQVEAAPTIVADFATFSTIVDSLDTNACYGAGGPGNVGPLCGLIGILTLDGVRYQLDGTAGGALTLSIQTGNNSIYEVALTPVPVPAAVWLFGSALGLLGWMRRRAA